MIFLILKFSPKSEPIMTKVPASILSGITSWYDLCKYSTPVIFILLVPAPIILAPILFKNVATLTISGSLATFSMIVVPFAFAATSIIFMVAPTLGISRYILAAFNSLASITYLLPSSTTVAPRAR